jgi:enterochelin esterase-like enzyme
LLSFFTGTKSLTFETMQLAKLSGIRVENTSVMSEFLDREVLVDFYLPPYPEPSASRSLLLINDGQDLVKMNFVSILEKLYEEQSIGPLLYVAIHAGVERRMEYGTQHQMDYKDRGVKAGAYTAFIFDELLPFIRKKFDQFSFTEKAFAGFSLGGLSALDIVWNRPGEFNKVGLFSPSLWWRSIDQFDDEYEDDKHRIMHQQIREGKYAPWLKFFLQCGNMDEKKDRNNNGVIDSIDDALDLIKELEAKGYERNADIKYLEMPDGHHDVFTWGRAFPDFLKWGWGRKG